MPNVFEELKRYVGFGPADEQALRAFYPAAQPHFEAITQTFYDRILETPKARAALEQGESTVGRLKVQLQVWLDLLLRGPWDAFYYETRARIGRVHVRIALPQHFMFGAMNVIRERLDATADQHHAGNQEQLRATRLALGRILDLELAIMLHTYREDLLAQQAKVERLSTFGQLVGSIGHELRNPLSVMESSLFLLRKGVTDERSVKHADRIAEQLGVANRIITNLLEMIRERPMNGAPTLLSPIVHEAVSVQSPPASVTVDYRGIDELPTVQGDAVQLRQVFVNLVENAIQAVGSVGAVTISGAVVDSFVEVFIDDTGPGIDPATRARLFEPLTTTKKHGVGLGLALVKRIIERHQGTIRYEPGMPGARFVIRLPLAT